MSKIYRAIRVFFFIVLSGGTLIAQNQTTVDSLLKVLKTDISNIEKVEAYIQIASEYSYSDSLNAAQYVDQAHQLSEEIEYTKGKIDVIYVRALINKEKGHFFDAEKLYHLTIQSSDSAQYQLGKARGFNGLGIIANYQGRLEEALDYNLQALKIFEELGDKKGLSKVYSNIGIVYGKQEDFKKSLTYFLKALDVAIELGDKHEIATNSGNTGRLYERKGDYEKSLEYHFQSLKIKEEIGDKNGVIFSYNNIGTIYKIQGDYERALEYGLKALMLIEETGISRFEGETLLLVGQYYQQQGKTQQAKRYLSNAVIASKKIGNVEDIKNSAKALSSVEKELGNYQAAYENLSLFKQMEDSLQNEELIRESTRLEAEYAFQQQKDSIQFASAAKRIELEKNIENRKLTQISTFIGLGLLSLLLIILFLFFQSKQKSNKLLTQTNENLQASNEELQQAQDELSRQHEYIKKSNNELQIKNTLINQSIKTAESIQQAFLPSEQQFKNFFSDYFIVNKPRDIVSGDFYWLSHKDNTMWVSVADCTGHGVPGAFMTMLGKSLLDRLVNAEGIQTPAEVLQQLDREIVLSLRQEETANTAGMDISLMKITKNESIEIQFSGAKSSLYVRRDDADLDIYRGDRVSIGGVKQQAVYFTNHNFEVSLGSDIYLSTDGYKDQNNIKRKAIGYKRFYSFLQKLESFSSSSQKKKFLEKELHNHMNGTEQRDDILILGVKV